MVDGIQVVDVNWNEAQRLDLNWNQGLVLSRRARAVVDEAGLETLLQAKRSKKLPESIPLFLYAREERTWYPAPGSGEIRFKKSGGKVMGYTWIPKTKRPKVIVQRTTQLEAVAEDILYVDKKANELYMEVLVPRPGSPAELYRVRKRILASVMHTCANCGSAAWKLVKESVVRRVEGRTKFSCFRLHFLCSKCKKTKLVAGARIRSLLDRLGRTLRVAFERLEEVEIGKASFTVKLSKGKYGLERC